MTKSKFSWQRERQDDNSLLYLFFWARTRSSFSPQLQLAISQLKGLNELEHSGKSLLQSHRTRLCERLVELSRKDAKSVSSFSVSDRQWPVNLKKAGMASRNIVMKKQCTLFWISFAVVFGLLVFGCLYFGWSYISFLEIQRLQLAGFSSTVFAVNLFPFYGVCYRRLP